MKNRSATPERFFMLTPTIMARLAALKDPAAAMLYLAVAQHADNPNRRWDLSTKQLAREVGVKSETTVRRAVDVLSSPGKVCRMIVGIRRPRHAEEGADRVDRCRAG